jgi:TonB-dependent receptor
MKKGITFMAHKPELNSTSHKPKFKKRLLASAIASCALASWSVTAIAQEPEVLEEVVVTGIRGSLERAMDMKRDAQGVVDAISAEDIGKFPDTNLAESLQRIPGVSIDRVDGEGSKVTVRGLAGDYNLVTLNSRQMPASSFGTGRSFEFANLASEAVSAIEVYKTGRADVQSGGMGALINIVTPRPLENPGMKAVIGAKAVLDKSAEDADPTPEISGLFSNTFADDTFGVALTGSYQEREGGARDANVGGWFTHDPASGLGDWATIPVEDQPTGNRTYAFPVNVGYSLTDIERKRINGQLTLQYRPVDTLTITADSLYVERETVIERHATGMWFMRASGIDIQWSDTDIAYPLVYTENTGNHEVDSSMTFNEAKSDLKSTGINVEWAATEQLTIEFDAHTSSSFSGPNGKWGNNNNFNVGVFDSYRASVDFSGDFPLLNLGYEDGRTTAIPDTSRAQLTNSAFRTQSQDSSVDEFQLKGEYTFDDGMLQSIQAGLGANEIDNRYFFVGYVGQNQGSWSGVGGGPETIGDIPESYFVVDQLSDYFDQGGLNSSDFQNNFIRTNWDELLELGAELYGSDTVGPGVLCPRAYCYTTDPSLANDGFADQSTVEESQFAYVQFNLQQDIAGMQADLAVGLRYEATDVESTSYLATYSEYITWPTVNEYRLQSAGSAFETTTGSYSKMLPNLDFSLEITDDIIGRASFSKTIARPNYDHIKGGFVWGTSPRIGQGDGSAGNPDLDPLESTNIDLSAEWYFDDASYVSVGYFQKEVVDFIGSSPVSIETGFHTPVNGPRWQEAVTAVGSDSDVSAIRDYFLNNFTEGVDGGVITALEEDPTLPFLITRPVNNKEVDIDGVELAVQHTFGDTGFGFQANMTKVNSDVEYDDSSKAEQFAIFGLSDSANLIAFYDKNAWQARFAYNWRDEFLASIGDSAGANPRYTEAYGQLDMSVSYEIIDGLTVSLEGLNVTDETIRQHGRHENMVLNYIESGPRYNLGVRYNF